jgi:nicotinamide riboside transporter PnuC
MVKYVIEKKPHHHAIEWVATFLSITGALMVSLQHFQGYYIWITANVLWMIFAFKYKHYGLLTLSVSYFIINIIGIVKWQFGFSVFG